MSPPFKAIAVTLLAGVIAGSMTACSKDLPTEPADRPGAGAAQPGVFLQAAPANDDFGNAVVITALPFNHSVNTSEATAAADDPIVEVCNLGDHTVWYRFTPTGNLRINVNTVASRPDQGISVFTGTRGNLTRVGCSDYGGVTFEAIAGKTYFFMIGTPAGQPGGNLVLNVDVGMEVGVTIDPVGTVNPSTGVATISGTVTCSRSAFFELGGAVQQGEASASQGSLFAAGDCDDVTPWEGEVAAENGRFEPGQAEVSVSAWFTADATTEERPAHASATVQLQTPPSSGIALSATGRFDGTVQYMSLKWSGATGARVDIYRNGSRLRTVANDGSDTNGRTFQGDATYVFRVCEAGTTTCSNEATVTFSSSIRLTATGRQEGAVQYMSLKWTGATGAKVDIYRNGARLRTTANDGSDTNGRTFQGAATYVFKVCQAGSTVCSNQATVVFN
jgi:hypothetical protein